MIKKHNDQKLSEVLKDLVNESKWKSKLYQTKVKEIWLLEMGVTIAQFTQSIRLRNKVLFLTLSSSPLKQELSYSKEKIKNIINEGLGEEYVEKVVIR